MQMTFNVLPNFFKYTYVNHVGKKFVIENVIPPTGHQVQF